MNKDFDTKKEKQTNGPQIGLWLYYDIVIAVKLNSYRRTAGIYIAQVQSNNAEWEASHC